MLRRDRDTEKGQEQDQWQLALQNVQASRKGTGTVVASRGADHAKSQVRAQLAEGAIASLPPENARNLVSLQLLINKTSHKSKPQTNVRATEKFYK
jgi:hypothetical protein